MDCDAVRTWVAPNVPYGATFVSVAARQLRNWPPLAAPSRL